MGKALLNLSDLAYRIIETPTSLEDKSKIGQTHGKVILAGGEDILAILPAASIFPVLETLARELPAALAQEIQKIIPEADKLPAFTMRAGVTIGHYKTPLQDMVEAAEGAMSKAKGESYLDPQILSNNPRAKERTGAALQVNLFKRSGAQTHLSLIHI